MRPVQPLKCIPDTFQRKVCAILQNRYKSTVVDEERYFLSPLRYKPMNRVRAKLMEDVRSLKEYPRIGHRGLMGKEWITFQDVDEVQGRFGMRAGEARGELVKFMGEVSEREERKLFKGGGIVRSAGGYEALKKICRDVADRSGSLVEYFEGAVLKSVEKGGTIVQENAIDMKRLLK